ncbi:MAG TPA: hypothetical protein VFZ07_12485 [Dongiaceae bacterium]|jgi:hypothetical protein
MKDRFMERIRTLAKLSIRRACGFAGLAICTFMVGLYPFPSMCFRTGAVLSAIAALVLFVKSKQAPKQNHRQTELWYMLERNPGLPEAYAGRVINSVLAQEYRRHAEYAGWIAAGLWVVGALFAYT